MSTLLATYSLCALVVLAYITIAFAIARRLNRGDVADVAWGGGFIAVAVTAFFLQPSQEVSLANLQFLVLVLVTFWGLRLSLHILRRLVKTKEDRRYSELRAKWKHPNLRLYTSVFLTQGALLLIISAPVVVLMASETSSFNIGLIAIGVVLWLIGFIFEAVGDEQLRHFVSNPKNKGKLMTSGLWRYSRHPNYFGELTQWWAIFLICFTVPLGWLGVFGPLLLSILILFISGVPLTEKRYAGRPDWEAYKKRTSMIIPLLSRLS